MLTSIFLKKPTLTYNLPTSITDVKEVMLTSVYQKPMFTYHVNISYFKNRY